VTTRLHGTIVAAGAGAQGLNFTLLAIPNLDAYKQAIARAFRSDRAGTVMGYVLLALLSLAAGLGALLWPGITAVVLTVWVAVWAFLTGLVEVALAFRRGEKAGERAAWAFGGLVSIALGVVLASARTVGGQGGPGRSTADRGSSALAPSHLLLRPATRFTAEARIPVPNR
jgi:hypothetical protein